MPDDESTPIRRAVVFGAAAGAVLMLSLHYGLDASGEAATAFAVIGALIAAGIAALYIRGNRGAVHDDENARRSSRGSALGFSAAFAVVAVAIGVLPAGALVPNLQSPVDSTQADQRSPGLVANASDELADLLDAATTTDPSSVKQVASVDVDNSSVALSTYSETSGVLTSYVRNPSGAVVASSTTDVASYDTPTFDIADLHVDDLNTLFSEALNNADLSMTSSDMLRVAAPATGQLPIVHITVGSQSDAPQTVEADADGGLYSSFLGGNPSTAYEEALSLASYAGIDADAPVVTELIFQGNQEGGTPVVSSPLDTQAGVAIRLAAAGPDAKPAIVYRTSGGVPVLQYVDPVALPAGMSAFAINDFATDLWWLTINDAGKPFYATGKDLASVSVPVGPIAVGGTMRLAMELQFGHIPTAHAIYTLDGKRLS